MLRDYYDNLSTLQVLQVFAVQQLQHLASTLWTHSCMIRRWTRYRVQRRITRRDMGGPSLAVLACQRDRLNIVGFWTCNAGSRRSVSIWVATLG